MRVIILGGPSTGKTTWADALAAKYNIPVRHTDDLKDMEWSASSEEASKWFDDPGDWIVEGTMAVRALRKWLANNPGKRLDAKIFYLTKTFGELSPGQSAMAKGCDTIFASVEDDLRERHMKYRVIRGTPKEDIV